MTLENIDSLKNKLRDKVTYQVTDYDCGWAVMATLMRVLKKDNVADNGLFERLGVDPNLGTSIKKIKQVFDEEGVKYTEIFDSGISRLIDETKKGNLCLVSYQAWGEKEEIEKKICGHYSVVFGVDDQYVWLFDPSWEPYWLEYQDCFESGIIRRPREEFEKLWVELDDDWKPIYEWMISVNTGDMVA